MANTEDQAEQDRREEDMIMSVLGRPEGYGESRKKKMRDLFPRLTEDSERDEVGFWMRRVRSDPVRAAYYADLVRADYPERLSNPNDDE